MATNCFCLVAPTISSEVLDQAQNNGDTATFTCQATGEPVPAISWYFNGVLVNESNIMKYIISVISLNFTAINSTLKIMNIESSDVGNYTCNATNVVSSDTSSGVLTINGEWLLMRHMQPDACTQGLRTTSLRAECVCIRRTMGAYATTTNIYIMLMQCGHILIVC